ncbi:SpoIIE family protein phosphatase [Geodermatophilus sp. FMUSA9-8]|uniref:SpoIIE family protein phosphatase n=1 Tax=Geodermatophilus sp. FMUSA9-8 TaxID=3120155 RepID=UPI00300B03FF
MDETSRHGGAPDAAVGDGDIPVPLDEVAAQLRSELAIGAAGIGTFDWDLETGHLDWDQRLEEIFGYATGEFDHTIAGFNDRLHEDDVARVGDALEDAIESCGDFQALYRVRPPGGDLRWVAARGRALCDVDGRATRLLGAAYDVTDQHVADEGVVRVLEAMPAGFYSLDRAWRFTYVNAEAERLLQRSRAELVGQVIWDAFPATVGSVFEDGYRRAADGEPVSFEAHYPPPLNGWYEIRAWPSPDGVSVYFLEVTARRSAEEAARRANQRLALVAEASIELGRSLTADAATTRLPQLVVPTLADGAIVTVFDARRLPRSAGSWHADPQTRPLLQNYAAARLPVLLSIPTVTQALTTGSPVSVDGDEALGLLHDEASRELLRRLAPRSVLLVPLQGRGRTLGLLTLLFGGRRRLNDDDLTDVQDLADRTGLALDNALLYDEQRQVAEQLQHSLLTAPPEPDHAEIVVRYLPAVRSAAVGGDWYDAFLQRDGATVLVIGDVVGHDIQAAATMGQLRGLLRGIATTGSPGPAQVLTDLDSSMALLDVATLATAAVARLEQTADERARGVTRVRWANAGHPPPFVVHRDGTVAALATEPGEMLLGVDPSARRTESVITLDHDATVILYTDGLVERRDEFLDDGLARLRAALTRHANRSLSELPDLLIDDLVEGRSLDDIAIVAIRLHRQDRPRPAEAGPVAIPDAVDGGR